MENNFKDNEQITVKQHYIPRFYMKNFANIKGSKENEKVLIGFYQFDKNLLKGNVPTKSICYEEFFYGEDGKIEKEFIAKESKWAEVIKNIIESDGYNLNDCDEKEIKRFAIFQYSRTLAMYRYSKDTISKMIQDANSNILNIEEEMMKRVIDENVGDIIHISAIIKACDKLSESLNDLEISVIKFKTNNKLIISDMPIITMNPFNPKTVGFNNIGIVILFPISPEILVVIYDGKMYKNLKSYMVITNEQEVINLNKYQVISAEERIMYKDEKELELYYNDCDLINKRKLYRGKRNVATGFNGKGTIIVSKSRNMDYYFKLSFCKLPKYLTKIPSDCRESCPREYNQKERFKLLVMIYKLIDESKSFPEENISKRKSGYSCMLKLMEDYWDIPMDKRKITPELMDNIKNAKATFYPSNVK